LRLRIGVEDRDLVLDLRDHLRSIGCIALEAGPGEVEVTIPDALTAAQERRELQTYMRLWSAARDVDVEIVNDERG
jgi:hypothetical protein